MALRLCFRSSGSRLALLRVRGLSARRKCCPGSTTFGNLRLLSTASAPIEDAEKDQQYVPATRAQLTRLAMVSAIPFVGFGFMDNVIMIVAGDAIDASLGTKLGVSTMAAAGLGNTLSDCIGLYTGDYIEGLCRKAGIREPKLTEEQLESREVRWTKTASSVLGLAFGCILGMFPLALQTDRKPLYFSAGQEQLYENLFRPHGITLHQFFDIMKEATYREAEPGTLLAEKGKLLGKVFMLYEGAVTATGKKTMIYRAKHDPDSSERRSSAANTAEDVKAVASGAILRGCIIGGTCLADPKHRATGAPYPYEVRATSKVRYLEWETEKLEELMESDKGIGSAMLSILYTNLAESLRRQGEAEKSNPLASAPLAGDDEHLRHLEDYKLILKVSIADDFIHPAERRLCSEFRTRRGISYDDHIATLHELGWTAHDWTCGGKGTTGHAATRTAEEMRRKIPELLLSSGIPSRLVATGQQEDQQALEQ